MVTFLIPQLDGASYVLPPGTGLATKRVNQLSRGLVTDTSVISKQVNRMVSPFSEKLIPMSAATNAGRPGLVIGSLKAMKEGS